MMNDELKSSKVQITEPLTLFKYHKHEDYKSIDISFLISLFYKKIWLVLCIIVSSIMLSIGISYYLHQGYKTNTVLYEPLAKQYKALYFNTDSNIPQSELFTLFLNRLSSAQNFNAFLEYSELQNDLLGANNPQRASFKKDFKFKVIIRNKDLLTGNINNSKITNTGVDAELIIFSPVKNISAELNKAYLAFTNQEFLNDFAKKQRELVILKIQKTEQMINLQLETIKNQLLFKIAKLKRQIAFIRENKEILPFKKQLAQLEKKLSTEQYNLHTLIQEKQSANYKFLEKILELHRLKNLPFDVSKIVCYVSTVSKIEKNNPNIKLATFLGAFFGFILAVLLILLNTGLKMRKELELSIQPNNYSIESSM